SAVPYTTLCGSVEFYLGEGEHEGVVYLGDEIGNGADVPARHADKAVHDDLPRAGLAVECRSLGKLAVLVDDHSSAPVVGDRPSASLLNDTTLPLLDFAVGPLIPPDELLGNLQRHARGFRQRPGSGVVAVGVVHGFCQFVPVVLGRRVVLVRADDILTPDRKSTRLNSS